MQIKNCLAEKGKMFSVKSYTEVKTLDIFC